MCQRVERGDPSLLLSTGEAALGVLNPLLGPAVPERPGHSEGSPTEGLQDDAGTGASLL